MSDLRYKCLPRISTGREISANPKGCRMSGAVGMLYTFSQRKYRPTMSSDWGPTTWSIKSVLQPPKHVNGPTAYSLRVPLHCAHRACPPHSVAYQCLELGKAVGRLRRGSIAFIDADAETCSSNSFTSINRSSRSGNSLRYQAFLIPRVESIAEA